MAASATASGDAVLVVRRSPQEFVSYYLDAAFHASPHQVTLSAARWTAKQWSRILINGIPTRVTPSHGAYTPAECHDALATDNLLYRTLHLTQLPSWVRSPTSYQPGSLSSLVVAFEGPTGKP
jgi:hypothetical protein